MEVVFMPWAGPLDLRPRSQPDAPNSIALGPVEVSPFSLLADDPAINRAAVEHLGAFFKIHTDMDSTPVSEVFVCSHGDTDFRELTQAQRDDILIVSDALVFATIFPTMRAVCSGQENLYHPPAPEVYRLVPQKFTPGVEHITVYSGAVVSGWSSFRNITVQRPHFISNHTIHPDLEALSALGHLLDDDFPANERERITRSLEWFRLAHSGTGSVSTASRVVMMTTAFEILLGIVESSRPNFADGLKDSIPASGLVREERDTGKKKRRMEDRTLMEWWGSDFYVLRSNIVHGTKTEPSAFAYLDTGLSQLFVADAVFGEVLIRDLDRLGCFEFDPSTKAAEYAASGLFGMNEDEWAAKLLDDHFRFGDLHRGLGWVSEVVGADVEESASEPD